MRRLFLTFALAAAAVPVLLPAAAHADTWPAGKPIQVIVPAPGGSGTGDTIARVLTERFELVARFPADDTPEASRLYDQQDAFYLPLTNFNGLRRPGPSFALYRHR